MTCTTFNSALSLVYSRDRTPDLLRGEERTQRVDNCTISNRSNYTRVQFDGAREAAFLIPVGPYAGRVLTAPGKFMTSFNFIGSAGESAVACLTPNELRAMAYGLLAAANWADSRDTAHGQRERRPRKGR